MKRLFVFFFSALLLASCGRAGDPANGAVQNQRASHYIGGNPAAQQQATHYINTNPTGLQQ